MSAYSGHDVMSGALWEPAAWNSHVGLASVPRCAPFIVTTRQNVSAVGSVIPTVTLLGAELVPVTVADVQRTVGHARSAHTSTCAPVKPVGSIQVSVGVRVLTMLP